MINSKLAVIVLLITIPHSMVARQNEEREQLKNLTVKIFDEFKAYTSHINIPLGQLVFSAGKHTHVASSNTDISLSLDEIGPMVTGESTLFKKLLIRFVLAHELGHRLQYANYPKNIIESTKGEGFIFRECNADILANFLCTGVINIVELPTLLQNPNFDLTAYNKNMYRSAIRVYQRIFEMDLNNSLVATHPSNLQRLMAIKAGTLLGNCYNMQYVAAPKGGAELKQYQFNSETLKIIANAIDFNPQDNPYMWAHSEAVRIINENNSFVRNLVRYNVIVKKERRPGTSDRFYNYSFRVFNGNDVSVRFSGRVYSEVDFGNETDNLMMSIPIDAGPFERVIPANSSIAITGRISYILADTMSSKLILPGDKKSLFFVFDANSPAIDLSTVPSADNDFTSWTTGIDAKIHDHIARIVQIRSRLSSYRKGIGTSDAVNDEEMKSKNVVYEPSFKAGQHDDQVLIYFPRTENIIYEFQATETNNLDTVNQRFELLVDKIKEGSSNYFTFNSLQEHDSERRVEVRDGKNKRVLFLRVVNNVSKNTYSVMVDIYGK